MEPCKKCNGDRKFVRNELIGNHLIAHFVCEKCGKKSKEITTLNFVEAQNFHISGG